MIKAGKVGIVPKGEYSPTVPYEKLNAVRYKNALYLARKNSTGILPTDKEYWMLSMEMDVTNEIISATEPSNQSTGDYWMQEYQ